MHGETACRITSGSEFTASCPLFASCYVLLPTLYLVPAYFLFPTLFRGLVLLLLFIFGTLLPLLHILVTSPTPDHLFWTFFLFIPPCCLLVVLVVNLKFYRKAIGSITEALFVA